MAAPDFDPKTKDDVLLANAYRCANPDCRMSIVLSKAGVISGTYKVGAVAHIRDARPHTPRFDQNMTDDQRAHISNALPLCLMCHGEVDSNPNLYPARVLERWKFLSENFVNYSRPVLSMTPPFFLLRNFVAGRDVMGGHVLVGPVGLDGVCTDVRLELATMHGGILSIFMDYSGDQGNVILGKDWRRFLTREGLSGTHIFQSLVNPAFFDFVSDVLVCPYRISCTFNYEGEALEFVGAWESLRAVTPNSNLAIFHSLTLPWLPLFMNWIAAYPTWAPGHTNLVIFLREFCVAWSSSADLTSISLGPGTLEKNWEASGYKCKRLLDTKNLNAPIAFSIFNEATSIHIVLVSGGDPASLLPFLPQDATSYSWQKVTQNGATKVGIANEFGFTTSALFEALPPIGF